jgi:hypothetical protein
MSEVKITKDGTLCCPCCNGPKSSEFRMQSLPSQGSWAPRGFAIPVALPPSRAAWQPRDKRRSGCLAGANKGRGRCPLPIFCYDFSIRWHQSSDGCNYLYFFDWTVISPIVL